MEGTWSWPRQNNFYITSAMKIIGVLWLSLLLLAAAGASLGGSSSSYSSENHDVDVLDYQDLLDKAERAPRISPRRAETTAAPRRKQQKRSPEDLKQFLDRGWLALEAPAPVAWTDGRDAPTNEDKRWRREKTRRLRASGKKARTTTTTTEAAPPRPEAEATARVVRELVLPCPLFVPQLVFPQPHPLLQRRWYLL
ncbi:uncharacterized protein LOC134538350 [Bacillus rossius redtenbacheri]|uniref:uncharacterized protein LOC134538350 n=1 Tax=Bacillus rossius redtenbacheri TaxID=93214 RepID=UPI002FDCFF2D